jgi:D-glycero-D-manno-heptose 1,7-bisphosphate phosphatase
VFDRDGTLIEFVPYLSKMSDVRIKDHVFDTLKILKEFGFRFGIITNQSVIARGITSERIVNQINSNIVDIIRRSTGVSIDFVKVCPHLPSEGCLCRKPNPALLIEAVYEFNIDPNLSYMVGDSESDIVLGKKLNLKTILINSPWGVAENSAADWIIESFEEIITKLEIGRVNFPRDI